MRTLAESYVDGMRQALRDLGFSGSTLDSLHAYFKTVGYTNSLTDQWHDFLIAQDYLSLSLNDFVDKLDSGVFFFLPIDVNLKWEDGTNLTWENGVILTWN